MNLPLLAIISGVVIGIYGILVLFKVAPSNAGSSTKAAGLGFAAFGILLFLAGIKLTPASSNDDNAIVPSNATYNSATSSESTSSTTTTSDTRSVIYVNGIAVHVDNKRTTPPDGYEVGFKCTDCDGEGKMIDPQNDNEYICPACAGKGFKWHKKSNY